MLPLKNFVFFDEFMTSLRLKQITKQQNNDINF